MSDTILQKIEDLFLRYGIRSVTMDDIARELGKSKKTLYEYCANKEELVAMVINSHIRKVQETINEIQQEYDNALESWINISNYQVRFLRDFNPSVIFDLKKYYPSAWQNFEKHKQEFMYQKMKENLQQGMREGLYRKDLNPDIIATHHIYKVEVFASPDTFRDIDVEPSTAIKELVKYHLYGVTSEKGRRELIKLLDHES